MEDTISNVPQTLGPADIIGGPMSSGLVGRTFQYAYPAGIRYRISFDQDNVYFKSLPHEKLPARSDKILTLPYRARELRENLYLAHWMVAERKGHITLTFDLQKRIVNCASLMPGEFELFEVAEFEEALENGEGALYHAL
ncbi:hypothetical protein BJY01DRAFT_247108 [Aspergillus pseudoustus]|uniref:Molybdenum cofactor biosynthesis protein F N-terminal domain-containing protein n=1 Tax=Aspergillus pseudoustus TaxID=1810923 RepID=A0ABR4K3U6_9EURO